VYNVGYVGNYIPLPSISETCVASIATGDAGWCAGDARCMQDVARCAVDDACVRGAMDAARPGSAPLTDASTEYVLGAHLLGECTK
jgi:hypothetical protein